jgi:regulator of PEP synthase PpsR (kinase-PPPase family)
MSATSNNSIVGYFSQIDVSKLSNNFYNQRMLRDLIGHIAELNLAIKKYDKLFNYTKYATSKIEKIMKNIEELSLAGVNSTNQRIKNLEKNLQNTSRNYATTKEILNSENILPKKITIETFINTLNVLHNAIKEVAKDILKLRSDKLFKSDILGKSADKKKEDFYEELIAISVSINLEKQKFIKLKRALEEAEAAQRAGESVSKLEARLKALRTRFDSISSLPIAGISTPHQRNSLTKVLTNIQRKINTSVRGGTRKQHHLRRNYTRRN